MRHIFTSDKRESYHNITKHTVKETKRELLPLKKESYSKQKNAEIQLYVWLCFFG